MKFTGLFDLIDFSLTHRVLLLRTTEIVDMKPENTDLLFSSTFYIELPTYFENLEILETTQEDCTYVQSRCISENIPLVDLDEVYVLYVNKTKYYIGARRLQVINNKYESGETSIGAKREFLK